VAMGGIREVDGKTGACGRHVTKQRASYQRLSPAGGQNPWK